MEKSPVLGISGYKWGGKQLNEDEPSFFRIFAPGASDRNTMPK